MIRNIAYLWSTVGRKILLALAGLGLSVFVVMHLMGNLTLFSPHPEDFNKYAHKLTSFGILLIFAELGLALVFITHIYLAITSTFKNRKARPTSYKNVKNAGQPSKKSLSSRSMIYTGLIISAFLIFHLATLKFGPGVEEGYVSKVEGKEIRDLHRLVVEKFSDTAHVIGYCAVMLLLGIHLRHGFWSAFQSLGANHPQFTPLIFVVGILFAVFITAGFFALPVYIYFTGGTP